MLENDDYRKAFTFGGAIRDAGTVKGKKQVNLQHRTGWRSKTTWDFGYFICHAIRL